MPPNVIFLRAFTQLITIPIWTITTCLPRVHSFYYAYLYLGVTSSARAQPSPAQPSPGRLNDTYARQLSKNII